MRFKEGQHPIVEHVGSNEGVLAIVEFDQRDFRISVYKSLLVNAANALEVSDIEGVLSTEIAWMFSLDLAVRLLFFLGPFERRQLVFGENQVFRSGLRL